MRKISVVLFAVALAMWSANDAPAAVIRLFGWAVNIDGVVANRPVGDPLSTPGDTDPIPPGVDVSAFSEVTGLGTVTVSLAGAGSHFVGAFFDHEVDEPTNTFFNEFGAESGTPTAGQSWEIDEPGFVFGDIFDNFLLSALDNSNGVPAGIENDVTMAMGWDFTLNSLDVAAIQFVLSETTPASGFFLTHTDPDSTASIHFSSILGIKSTPDVSPVPVPTTLLLLGSGLVGLAGWRRRRSQR